MTTRFAQHVQLRRAFGAHIVVRRNVRLPKQRQPNAERLAYSQALLALMSVALRMLKETLFPELPALVREAGFVHDAQGRTYADKVQRLIDEAARKLFSQFSDERLRGIARKAGDRVSKKQREELRRQIRAKLGDEVNVDVVAERGIAARVDAWASENVHLIKKVPRGFYDDIAQRAVASLRKGRRAEELASEIADRYSVSESRARLIARDQIGKLNGELNKARQRNIGVSRFVWRTAEDERVREEHVILDGRVFKWTSPPSEGIPGEPINCRCEAEPVLEDILDDL